jgi:hypothetical protein
MYGQMRPTCLARLARIYQFKQKRYFGIFRAEFAVLLRGDELPGAKLV